MKSKAEHNMSVTPRERMCVVHVSEVQKVQHAN